MRAEPGLPLLSKSAGPRLSGKRTRQLKRLKQLWPSPQKSNPRPRSRIKAPRLSTSGPLCLAATTLFRAYEAKQQTPPSAIMATGRSTNVPGTSCCQYPDWRRDQGKLVGRRLHVPDPLDPPFMFPPGAAPRKRYIMTPPFTSMRCPLTQPLSAASSEAIAGPMSSGPATRPRAV